MSIEKTIGPEKFAEIVSNYENLILSEKDVLFIQFKSEKLDKNQLNGLQEWLYEKLIDKVIPKYKKEFNIDIQCLKFSSHLEVRNLSKLPEEKILKIFKMFDWVLEKL